VVCCAVHGRYCCCQLLHSDDCCCVVAAAVAAVGPLQVKHHWQPNTRLPLEHIRSTHSLACCQPLLLLQQLLL
jgi:hypothetical protein